VEPNGGGAPRARQRLGAAWAAIGAGLLIGLAVMLLIFWLVK
jgi:hypothetical protein